MIHNILQMLQRETYGFPPSSPRPPALMTPTSPAMPLSPHNWPLLSPNVAAAAAAGETFPNLSHLISQANSVTLSPAPSLESQNGNSPANHAGHQPVKSEPMISSIHQLYPPPSSSANSLSVPPPLNNLSRRSQSASSSHSDSEVRLNLFFRRKFLNNFSLINFAQKYINFIIFLTYYINHL